MDDTLKNQFLKIELPGLDHEYYLSRLFSYPENEWFTPQNLEHQDFQICFEMQMWNIIQKMNEPIWTESGYRGQRIYFKYSTNLIYKS